MFIIRRLQLAKSPCLLHPNLFTIFLNKFHNVASILFVEEVTFKRMGLNEGQFTDFFSYTSLEITKKSHTKSQNHKKNHMQKASKITNH